MSPLYALLHVVAGFGLAHATLLTNGSTNCAGGDNVDFNGVSALSLLQTELALRTTGAKPSPALAVEEALLKHDDLMQTRRWDDMSQRRFPGRAYVDFLTCWAAFAEQHKLPWVVMHGALLHHTRDKEHAPWDPDMDILTTEEAQYLIREQFRGMDRSSRVWTGSSAGLELPGPDISNCRDMKKQYGVDELNMGPAFGNLQSAEGWIEFWTAQNESERYKTFYPDFETDLFANRQLVQYQIRQDDGTLASVPIYVPEKNYSDWVLSAQYDTEAVANRYNASSSQPTFNQWTGQRWIFNESVWLLAKNGSGRSFDYGPDSLLQSHMERDSDDRKIEVHKAWLSSMAKHLQESKTDTASCICIAGVIFAVWGSWHISCTCLFDSLKSTASTPLGLDSVGAKIIFAAYVLLMVSCTFITKAIEDTGPDTQFLVALLFIAKLLVSLVLWRIQDGSFVELVSAARREWKLLLKYNVIACLFAVSDVLRLEFVQNTSPSTFHVLINLRTIMLVSVWQWVMNYKLLGCHWMSLVCIGIGCFVKEYPMLHSTSGPPMVAWMELVALMFSASLGLVLNELMLKRSNTGTTMPLNFQNSALYSFGFIWMLVYSFLMSFSGRAAAPPFFQMEQWQRMLNTLPLLWLAVSTALGICCSYFLKILSNVAKEVATGFEVLISLPFDTLIFGTHLGAWELIGSGLVLFGIDVFARWPLIAPEQSGDTKSPEKAGGAKSEPDQAAGPKPTSYQRAATPKSP